MKRALICILVIMISFISVKTLDAQQSKKKVFIVHSYDPENVCGRPQDMGAVAMFKKLGFREGEDIVFHRFYMDTKRKYITPEAMKMRGQEAISAIRNVNPDIVMVLDDNAARYVMLPLVKSEYPIVFSGMNRPIEEYDKEVDVMISRTHPGYNITGVLETVRLIASFKLLKEIKSNVKKILVITDTNPTGKGICTILHSQMQSNPEFPIEIETRIAKTFADYKKCVREANMREDLHAIFPNVSGLNKSHGERAVLPEIIEWTVKNSKKPEVGMTYFLVEFGFLCGVTVDFPALGGQAAVKAARILSGEDPGDIPIEDATRFAIALNLARADQLNIRIPFRILGAADKVYQTMKLYPSYRMGKRTFLEK